MSFKIIMTTSVTRSRVSQNNSRSARPRPRPIFVVSDRSCPKTDGLRPQLFTQNAIGLHRSRSSDSWPVAIFFGGQVHRRVILVDANPFVCNVSTAACLHSCVKYSDHVIRINILCCTVLYRVEIDNLYNAVN